MNPSDPEPGFSKRLVFLAPLAMAIMAPVTLPVPVLRSLVGDRFAVSEFSTSLFMSVNMVGAALAAPLAGALADRIGHRRELIVGALLVDALLFYSMTLELPFQAFLALRFLEGCAHIFALSILLSVAASLGGAVGRGQTMGLTGGGMMLGVAFGAPMGGFLGRTDTTRPLYVGAALLVFAAGLALASLREPAHVERHAGFGAIWRSVRAHKAMLAPLVFAFADRFTVGFYTTTFSLFASGLHNASPPQVGIWISAFMLPFALLSFPFGLLANRYSKTALLCVGSLAYGLLTASLGFWPTAVIPFGMAVIGLFAAVMFVPSMMMTIDVTPAAIRSTAMGAFNTAGSLGFILGPLVGGFVSDTVRAQSDAATGYQAAFAVAGLAEIACVVIALPFLLRLRAQGKTN